MKAKKRLDLLPEGGISVVAKEADMSKSYAIVLLKEMPDVPNTYLGNKFKECLSKQLLKKALDVKKEYGNEAFVKQKLKVFNELGLEI